MSRIKAGPAVVLADVVGIGGEVRYSRRIAIRVIQRVIAKQLQLRSDPHVTVHDELTLLEIRFRHVLVDVSSLRIGTGTSTGEWGVGIDRRELIKSPRIEIRHRKCRRLRELPLYTHRPLQRVRRM